MNAAVADLVSALLGARSGASGPLPAHVNALRRDISTGAMRPCRHILTVLLTDIAQGVPLDRCLEVCRRLTAILTTAARVSRGGTALSLDAAMDAEVQVDLDTDGLQWRVRSGDHSRATLMQLHAKCRHHRDLLDQITVGIEMELYGAVA